MYYSVLPLFFHSSCSVYCGSVQDSEHWAAALLLALRQLRLSALAGAVPPFSMAPSGLSSVVFSLLLICPWPLQPCASSGPGPITVPFHSWVRRPSPLSLSVFSLSCWQEHLALDLPSQHSCFSWSSQR